MMGMPYYVVARKSVKPYMTDPLSSTVLSITTQKPQTLCLDSADARLLRGRRVAIVDDVISTGESLRAMEELLHACDANIIARAAILAEDKAADRDDIIYLERLPLFDARPARSSDLPAACQGDGSAVPSGCRPLRLTARGPRGSPEFLSADKKAFRPFDSEIARAVSGKRKIGSPFALVVDLARARGAWLFLEKNTSSSRVRA